MRSVIAGALLLAACSVNVPEGRFACRAGEPCPPGMQCGPDGLCRTGPPRDGGATGCTTTAECDDRHACTIDLCDVSGTCVHIPQPSMCDDGVPCTVDDCDPSAGCVASPDDSQCPADTVACTREVCNAERGCVSVPDPALCDDGVACTVNTCGLDGCTSEPMDSLCTAGPGGVCEATGCRYSTCDATTCPPIGDGGCITRSCAGSVCVESRMSCEDGNPCTTDVCSGGICTRTNNADPCDDGNPCTLFDRCNAGTCRGSTRTCGACEACDPSFGCVPDARTTGNPCGVRSFTNDPMCCDGVCVNLLVDGNCGGCGVRCASECVATFGVGRCACNGPGDCPSGFSCTGTASSGGQCSCDGNGSCPPTRTCRSAALDERPIAACLP